MNKKILLSFDTEEFDIPVEYDQDVDEKTQLSIGAKGTEVVLNLLEKLDIKATFFITARFAMHHKELVKRIGKKHEIASHGYEHSSFSEKDFERSKKVLEKISGKKVIGFRMPRLQKTDSSALKKAGYAYSSSINPTFLPGRYNNFFHKRTVFHKDGLINLPVSVTPLVRFPLFWLSFKNVPFFLTKIAAKITLNTDKYLNLYFHPWEFMDIGNFKLPRYIKRNSGHKMVSSLEKYIIWLKKQGTFCTCSEFVRELSISKNM